jgi:hypothetical protein
MPDHLGKPRNRPVRPEWFDKWLSLKNFMTVFSEHNDITIVADNVNDDAYQKLISLYPDVNVERTNFGSNAGSFIFSLEEACTLDPATIVYFVEDDYIHHEGSDLIIEQGLSISPYVSLYDHPDKYWGGNVNKQSTIFMTNDVHWRTTESTTMTFASTVQFLLKDKDLFYKWCFGTDNWTHDTQLFSAISERRGLITPIPGYATHMDSWVMAKMVDWKEVLDRTT